MNRDLEQLFSRDGLIHPAYPSHESPLHRRFTGRRDLWTDATYKDAAVCLSCTADECEGETKCFRRRMAWLETAQKETARLPAEVLLDDLIYADEVCEDGGGWYDLPWE